LTRKPKNREKKLKYTNVIMRDKIVTKIFKKWLYKYHFFLFKTTKSFFFFFAYLWSERVTLMIASLC